MTDDSHRQHSHVRVEEYSSKLSNSVNNIAVKYANEPDKESSHAKELFNELLEQSFRLYGVPMNKDRTPCYVYDSLMDTLYYCIERYDPERGFFTRFVNFKRSRNRKSMAKKEKAEQKKLVPFNDEYAFDDDDNAFGDDDNFSDKIGEVEIAHSSIVTKAPQDEIEEATKQEESYSKATASLTKVVNHFSEYLNHKEDKRHSLASKAHVKVNLTQWLVNAVKQQRYFYDCEPFVQLEKELFSIIDKDLLDKITTSHCESIRDIRKTQLVADYGDVIRYGDPSMKGRIPALWQLPNDAVIDHLATIGILSEKGGPIDTSTVSRHRTQFRTMLAKCA